MISKVIYCHYNLNHIIFPKCDNRGLKCSVLYLVGIVCHIIVLTVVESLYSDELDVKFESLCVRSGSVMMQTNHPCPTKILAKKI